MGDGERRKVSVLTVGDGDFTCSLALLRAYDGTRDDAVIPPRFKIHRLVATTLLPDEGALLNLYPSARDTLQQLRQYNFCTVLYGVDATCLCEDSRLSQPAFFFDYILFHHPHLGYNDAITPTEQNLRHQRLLASYFKSARQLLNTSRNDSAFLHVCLCGKERTNWDLDGILATQGDLQLAHVQPASRPIFDHNQPQIEKRSRTRRGHWLGRYGYRHQPTDPHATQFATNASTSQHFFIRNNTFPGDETS